MTYEHIRVEREGHLAIVTIAREKALNALSGDVLSELVDAAAALEKDKEVRVVAITGAGEKAFVAGADIAEMQEMSAYEASALSGLGNHLGRAIEESERPWIAAVNGFALGGGCELALACDFIYASTAARFGQPEVKLGVIPGFGGTQRLARRVGVAKARELVYTGDLIGADEALRIGLADKVVAPDQLMGTVRELAGRIAGNGPMAVAAAKRVIHEGQSLALGDALQLERQAFASLFDSEDQREGMAAFLAKRKAEFKGR
jgi:enoyl-CoA hydratase